MQRFSFFVCFIGFSLLLSCKKDEGPYQNSGLVGKWKLTESLLDPGDGSGKFVKLSEEASSVVEFKANGDFKEVKGIIYSSINPYDTYKLLDNNQIELSIKDNKNNFPPAIWYYKDLTASSLTIGFPCIEPCMGKYIAIK